MAATITPCWFVPGPGPRSTWQSRPPTGRDSRLEHPLADVEEEQKRYRQRLADAEKCLAGCRQREGAVFPFAEELSAKREELANVEKALAQDVEGTSVNAAIAA
jgi:hypothetical protein